MHFKILEKVNSARKIRYIMKIYPEIRDVNNALELEEKCVYNCYLTLRFGLLSIPLAILTSIIQSSLPAVPSIQRLVFRNPKLEKERRSESLINIMKVLTVNYEQHKIRED